MNTDKLAKELQDAHPDLLWSYRRPGSDSHTSVPERMLAPKEVARRLGVSLPTAYKRMQQMEHVVVGARSVRVRETVLTTYLAANTKPAVPVKPRRPGAHRIRISKQPPAAEDQPPPADRLYRKKSRKTGQYAGPWYASYYEVDGKRRQFSTHCLDRVAAWHVLQQREREVRDRQRRSK
jgi:predicted DNA-binding transcriptional regulator AlpA